MEYLLTISGHVLRLPRKKVIDALALIIYLALVILFVIALKPGLVVGHLLFFIVPGLYLVARYWRENYHAFLFSIVAGIATGVPLQIVAELNLVWTYNPVFFPPLDAWGWYVLWIGFTISVYSVFFDEHVHPVPKHHRFWRNHYKFLLLATAVLAGTAFSVLAYPSVFVMSHSYLVFGSLIIGVPTVLILFYHPHLLRDIFKAAIFLSFFALVYEIIGLRVGWWTYPGEYIATVELLGAVIPVEELILWVALGSLWAITGYEEIERN